MMQTTDVRDAALGAVNQSKSFIGRQVDARTTQIGQQIGGVADDLRHVGDQLRQNAAVGGAATYVDQGADAIERVGRYLETSNSDQLVRDLESLARAQPWAFATGAMVLGFAAARFLKTSSARRYYDSYDAGYGDPTGIRSGGQRYAT